MIGHWIAGVLIGLFASGCVRSPQSMFGDAAVYSSAHSGYIVVPLEQEAAVKRGEAKAGEHLVLRSPTSGEKLRCESEVKRWAPTYARVLANEAYDRSWENVSLTVLFPFTAVGYFLKGTGLALIGVPYAPAAIGYPEEVDTMVQKGLTALVASRNDEAIVWLERAIGQAPAARRDTHALYFLGRAYEGADRREAAMDAYRAFLEEAEVANGVAYVDARRRLVLGGDAPPVPCSSQRSVPMAYPKVGEAQ